jgi:hypothetical protein
VGRSRGEREYEALIGSAPGGGPGRAPAEFLSSERLLGLAAVAAVDNDPDRAARLVGAATAHSYGAQQHEIKARLDAAFLDPARERQGTDAWDTAVHAGAALSFEDAIAYALEDPGA